MLDKLLHNCIKGFACLAVAFFAMANKPCFADDSFLMTFFPREGSTGGYYQNLYSGLDNNFFFDLNRAFLFREVDKNVSYNPVNSVVKPIFDNTGLTSALANWDVNNPQYYPTCTLVTYNDSSYLLISFCKYSGFIDISEPTLSSSEARFDSDPYFSIFRNVSFSYTSGTDLYGYFPACMRKNPSYSTYFQIPINNQVGETYNSCRSVYFRSRFNSSLTGFVSGSDFSSYFSYYLGGTSDSLLGNAFSTWVSSALPFFYICIDLNSSAAYFSTSGPCVLRLGSDSALFSSELLFSYGYVYTYGDTLRAKTEFTDFVLSGYFFQYATSNVDIFTLYCNKYFVTNARPTSTPMPTPTDIPPWRDSELPTPTAYPSVTVAPLPTGIVTDYIPLLDLPSTENTLANITGIIKEFNSIFSRKVFALGSYTLQVMYYFSGWFKFIFLVPAGVFIAFLIGRLRKK